MNPSYTSLRREQLMCIFGHQKGETEIVLCGSLGILVTNMNIFWQSRKKNESLFGKLSDILMHPVHYFACVRSFSYVLCDAGDVVLG